MKTALHRVIGVIVVLFAGIGIGEAHPHAYVQFAATGIFKESGVSALRVSWTFDPAFSQAVLAQQKRASTDLYALVERELSAQQSVLEVKVNGKKYALTPAHRPKASVKEGVITCVVEIPYKEFASASNSEIRVSVCDPSYFCEVKESDMPIQLENNTCFAVKGSVRENPNETFYFGSLHPVELILSITPSRQPRFDMETPALALTSSDALPQ